MSGRFFLDTNVLVYTFDPRDSAKQARARELVEEALGEQRGLISFQVVQEFLNVATRKFEPPLAHADCRTYLDRVLRPLCEVFPTIELYREALFLAERWRYGVYDSLILAAAIQAGCGTLYSEDLHHGQKIQDLTIVDPFVNAPKAPATKADEPPVGGDAR
ncbi:MAG: PIN domain-containing protein [bacterium]|nr:PIN domain-containing protein [bacterium]